MDEGAGAIPFPGHAWAEEDVVDPAVGVFAREEMGPGDRAGHEPGTTGLRGVAVAFVGAGIDEGIPAPAEDGPQRAGIAEVVEIPHDGEVGVGVAGEPGVEEAAEDEGFLLADFVLGGLGGFAAGLEVDGEESEAIVVGSVDVGLEDAAGGAEAAAAEEEGFVGMLLETGDGPAAEQGDLDMGIVAIGEAPVWVIESFAGEEGAEFEEGVGSADFLKREDIGVEGAERLSDEGLRVGGFGGATVEGCDEVILEVPSGHGERGRAGGGGRGVEAEQEAKREGGTDPGRRGVARVSFHGFDAVD